MLGSSIPKRAVARFLLPALIGLRDLCQKLQTKYLLISFSSDGFIGKEEMVEMLSRLGEVQVLDREYNTFRGSRNLNGRDIHIKEYLYLVEKKGEKYGKV